MIEEYLESEVSNEANSIVNQYNFIISNNNDTMTKAQYFKINKRK